MLMKGNREALCVAKAKCKCARDFFKARLRLRLRLRSCPRHLRVSARSRIARQWLTLPLPCFDCRLSHAPSSGEAEVAVGRLPWEEGWRTCVCVSWRTGRRSSSSTSPPTTGACLTPLESMRLGTRAEGRTVRPQKRTSRDACIRPTRGALSRVDCVPPRPPMAMRSRAAACVRSARAVTCIACPVALAARPRGAAPGAPRRAYSVSHAFSRLPPCSQRWCVCHFDGPF